MDDLKQKYLSQIADAANEAALEDIRLAAVGKKGEVALKMRELGKMTPEERQVAGPALNSRMRSTAPLPPKRPRGAMPRWMNVCAVNGWM